MFKYFDIHERGFVSLSDFMKTMEKIGLYYHQAELQPLFEIVYATGSEEGFSLDYKEFSSLVFGNRDCLKG
jgi:Ca2+-binding EF-hand superfamily protein